MKNFLAAYQSKGLIKKERIGFDQVIKYINRARKDLSVAEENLKIDTEASYNYAYLAMLRTGRALMLSHGFRPAGGQQHKTVVDFSRYILGREYPAPVQKFDRMRKKRNCFTYDEPDMLVSDTETKNALLAARDFVNKASEYIQDKNPQLKLF